MEKSYNQSPKTPEEKISDLLRQIPKKEASATFENRLMANIRRIDEGHDIRPLARKTSSSYLVASFATAAGLAMAFFIFNLGDTNASDENNVPIAIDQQTTVPKDSVKESRKNFDRPVNMVGDKKEN
jgi:hypothetical protein